MTVAIPYLLIVVAMGYSRQGVALGLAMLGLNALSNRSTLWFAVWVALATTFHKSAVVLLPIGALASAQNRYWTAAWVGLTTALVYKQLVEKDVDLLYVNYVQAEYQSQGALIRLLMNAIPATILLVWRSRFQFTEADRRLWTWFAVISLALLSLLVVSRSSTAVDRVALYLLPLQIVVFSRLPYVFGKQGDDQPLLVENGNCYTFDAVFLMRRRDLSRVTSAILLYYGMVQFYVAYFWRERVLMGALSILFV